MKTRIYALLFMLFASTSIFAQNESGSVTGSVKEVKPHFGGQQTLVVANTDLVLISDPKDASGNTFEINSQFKDILIREGNQFVLNPKYKDKIIRFNYTINGKGWKCISTASEVKPKNIKMHTQVNSK
jgi:hypothetical protein